MRALPIKILLCYLMVYIVWGTTYFFIKLTVATIPPYYLVGIRFTLAGAVFLAIAAATGHLRRFPLARELWSALFLGVFLLMGGNGLVSVGQKTVDSYLAALVIASTPFAVAIFDWILFRKKLQFTVFFGIAVGVCGVGLILFNGQNLLSSFTPGIWLVIAGFSAWAFATSLGHRMAVHPNTLINSGLQMLIAGTISLVLSIGLYGPPQEVFPQVSLESWLAMAYLAGPGAAAFFCYSYLVKHEPAIRVVSYAIINPLIAVTVGILFAHEKATPLLWVGFPLVLVGLVLMLYGPVWLRGRNGTK